MADGNDGVRRRKRKLPSMAELISKGKEFLGLTKKKQRKDRHYEFGTDPVTGFRNNKGTYKGQPKKLRKEISSTSETSDNELEVESRDDLCESSLPTTTCSTMTGEMKDILLDAQELLVRWQEIDSPKKQKWAERQASLNESWEECRSVIFKALLQATFAIPEDVMCQRCTHKVSVVKCHTCSSTKHLCQECDQTIHECWPFHDRDAMVNGHYVPIPATTSRGSDGEWVIVERSLLTDLFCSTCGTCSKCKPLGILPESHCIVVTLRGRFDINHRTYKCLECCKILCTSDPVVVAQSGFWPGSIRDMTYVFDQDLFLYWDLLQKQLPGVSERSFLKSLELFSRRKGRVATINATAFATSFKEWKYCQFELDKLRHINWMECPACSDSQHSVHVDGNMKLYRFKSAGMCNIGSIGCAN